MLSLGPEEAVLSDNEGARFTVTSRREHRPPGPPGHPAVRDGRDSSTRLRASTVSRVPALRSASSGVPSGSAVSISAVHRSP